MVVLVTVPPVVRKIFDRVVLGPEEIEPENNAKKEVKQ
ncbi:penicillin-binding protein 2 (PBP-2) [Vibrio sp. JCM 18904]|nr:penicillin-binding protein 2 (PBP-2) [Vibrio sp. JCM 18904]